MEKAIRKHRSRLNRPTAGGLVFDAFNILFMLILCFITLYPLYYVLCASFSDNIPLLSHPGALFYPMVTQTVSSGGTATHNYMAQQGVFGFTLGAYRLAFTHPLLVSGYVNILIVLAASLPLNIFLTLCCGYFMASRNMMFKKPVIFLVMFTMFFQGGMIPAFLNIQSLGLYNTLWALILPGGMSVYNAIICKTAIEAVPDSLQESAYIDGANDIVIVFRIVLPLIMPTIAVLLLYYGVGHWNSWFNAALYVKDNDKLPIQNVLRAVLIANSNILNAAATENDQINQFAETIKYAAIVLTTVPVLCIYPFLQKYFVKGVMIGAVKG